MTSDLRARAASILTLSTLTLALVGLAGCGGGASTAAGGASSTQTVSSRSGTSTAGHPAAVLTNAQFIAQADAICDRSNARITAIKPRNNSPSEVQRIVPRHLALERATIAALEKLTPPEALAGNWAQVLKVRRTLAHELDELLAAAKRHDAAAIGKLGSAKGLAHLVLTNAAHGAGLKQCGRLG